MCKRLLVAFLLLHSCVFADYSPRNIIIFIGDGMGPEQIKAGEFFSGRSDSFKAFSQHAKVSTYSANSSITDSAASATAISGGKKVNNGVISQNLLDPQEMVLIPKNSIWEYHSEGFLPDAAWYLKDFDDSGWNSGNAKLGYGDADVATVLDFGSDAANKYTTAYFRKKFLVEDVSALKVLRLNLKRDDGAVVYLNNQEVFRSNMPAGTVTYNTLAVSAVGGSAENNFFQPHSLDKSLLVNGENTLAVEIHQSTPASSDLGFDLELKSGDYNIETMLEYYKLKNKGTGLVTTTFVTHATPAAFGAHESSRNNYREIGYDYLFQTRPDLILGGGHSSISANDASSAGYTVLNNLDELSLVGLSPVVGFFGNTHLPYEYDGLGSLPHLSEMTAAALSYLDQFTDGFLLMVEGGRIDHAGHANDIVRMIPEFLEFRNSVDYAMNWAKDRHDTLILVTADHETGGLQILQDNGEGNIPDFSWSTGGHTGIDVDLFAWGFGDDNFVSDIDNTEINSLIKNAGQIYNGNSAPLITTITNIDTHNKIINLSAMVTDDNLAVPKGFLSYRWSQLSGDTAFITSPDSLNTQIELPAKGVYQFQLLADDGISESKKTVVVDFTLPAVDLAVSYRKKVLKLNLETSNFTSCFPDVRIYLKKKRSRFKRLLLETSLNSENAVFNIERLRKLNVLTRTGKKAKRILFFAEAECASLAASSENILLPKRGYSTDGRGIFIRRWLRKVAHNLKIS